MIKYENYQGLWRIHEEEQNKEQGPRHHRHESKTKDELRVVAIKKN